MKLPTFSSGIRVAAFSIVSIALCTATIVNLKAPARGLHLQKHARDELHRVATLLDGNPFAREITSIDSENTRQVIGATEIYNKLFSDDSVAFELYVAYWRPGAAELRHAYGHIPDGCWIYSGLKCVDGVSGVLYNVDGIGLRPAEWRRFVGVGRDQYVIYWCLIGDRLFPYRYDKSARPRSPAVENRPFSISRVFAESTFLLDWNARFYGANTSSDYFAQPTVTTETYFIRINSETRIEILARNAMFQEQIRKLAKLGIGAPEKVVPD